MDRLDPIYKNHVTITGNPQAEQTMVFVHGFGTDQTAWQQVASAFFDEFKIILFDNVGAGQAAAEAFIQHRYLNLHPYADDLVKIAEVLDLKQVILIGHSVGGMISLLATIRAPTLAARLILIGASPRYVNDEQYFGGFTDNDIAEIYSAVVQRQAAWADDFAPMVMANPEHPHLSEYYASTIKSIPTRQTLTVLCSIFQSDHRQDLALVNTPTLLIQAKEDFAVPLAVANYLHQHIAGSQLAVIEATGHLPHISAPAEVIAAIRAFLK
ncbi:MULTISPECIES: alpha/beta fold hydrolase [Methylomonas]|uniref:AB hydrolase-1 domain-containing protein n=2 Tax=Methylomonas TaxID=416 RepID=A0A126T5S2_9GAMM|nr:MULTISPECIES: alpha/beta hydrolase [Methylomonas]AMK77425.1 hypothetical protein JT25_013200 [Methylomonas denitrificans]OAI05016.1 hypothetical protein A1342_11365 [Methylomonas methanica]TCV84535.1 sigma-B regulation protein RsbQ [Methylomonas methanica]